jgi:hypothetical protein
MRPATALLSAAGLLLLPLAVQAQSVEEKIASAMSAGPASIAEHATIKDWDNTTLREGSNEWTCLPDVPSTPGNDPMCLDEPWLNWVHAWMNKEEPTYDRMGFGYMLAGGSPGSNLDPYAEAPTPDNEWLDEGVPHVMIIVPDAAALEGLPEHPDQGGPWVMWPGTPYVHIMAPMPER